MREGGDGIETLINIFGVLVGIGYFAVLVAGLKLSKRAGFKEGMICSLLLILLKLNDYFSPSYMIPFIEGYSNRTGLPPISMLIATFNYQLTLIECIAIGWLVLGLYRRWRRLPVQNSAYGNSEA